MSRYAPARPQPKAPRVDREKTCPSLLRVFVNPAHHHPDSAFTVKSVPVSKEFQVYVWRDSTLREVLLSLRDAAPQLRGDILAKYSLKLVFWDAKLDRYTSTDLAQISAKDLGSSPSEHRRPGGPIERTLSDAKYVVGDFIDVAYIVPGAVPSGGAAAGSFSANGPQFAPLSAPSGTRAAPGGFPAARPAAPGPRPVGRGDTWAQMRPGPSGPNFRAGPPGGRDGGGTGGPRFGPGGGRPSPADHGWGNRRPRADPSQDRPQSKSSTLSRQGRRNSRSLSPDPTRQSRPRPRSRSRSRSPARAHPRSPSPRPTAVGRTRDRSDSAPPRRATPPHMSGRKAVDDQDEDMRA